MTCFFSRVVLYISLDVLWSLYFIIIEIGTFQNNVPGYGDGAKEDCSDLPPNQRKKRLQQKLDEIQAKIQQETAARDGLMKMKGVYEQNPALGDPMSIEGQLNQSSNKLDKLGAELAKFQGYLEEAMRAGVSLSR